MIAEITDPKLRQLAIEHNAVADPCYDQTPFADLLGGAT